MKYLNIVSIFPALTETFVFREIRTMQQMGHEVMIGQLRPVAGRPTAPGADDLRPYVIEARLLGWSTFAGLIFFTSTKPKLTWNYSRLVFGSLSDVVNMSKLLYILLASIGLAYRLRRTGLQHVRGHHLHSEAVSAMFVAGFLGIPYSFTGHTVKTYYPRAVLKAVILKAEFITAISLQVKDFIESLGAAAGQVRLVHNGVELRDFPARKGEPISELPVILAVGRLDYKKGFHVLISACSLLRDEGMRFRCVIVGHGDEWNRLTALGEKARILDQVEMVGSLDFPNVQQWYERATLLVVPSVVAPDGSTDGLPTVMIEAFARGVPVVGASTAGIPEVIQNGSNGFLVAADSARELADRIKDLLRHSELREKFAREGRRTAERIFDLERNAAIISELMCGRASECAQSRSSMASVPPLEPAALDPTSLAS